MSSKFEMRNLSIFFVICAAVVLYQARSAAGQESIQVDQNRAVPGFPETINFHISASGGTEIESLVLHYGTNTLSCQNDGAQQQIRIDPTLEVEEEWEWELKRSGSLPPGAMVWWEWELTDADGVTFTTDREELSVDDDRHRWRSLTRENVTVYWFNGDTSFAEDTLARTQEELARISDEVGVSLPGEIQLWVYPTAADVRDALVISHEWAGAVAFPDYNIMIISLAPGQTDWASDVIPHELTHLVVGVSAFNCRGGNLPTWLNEGLAVSAEGSVSVDDQERIEQALEDDRLPPLRSLADGFSAYGGGARLAYAQSGEVTRYLLDQFGPEQINALIKAIGTGMTIDNALKEVYGFDTDGLDASWRTTQGYAPTPSPSISGDLSEVTPTLIPTLPLISLPQVTPATDTPLPATETPQSDQLEPSPTPVQAVSSTPKKVATEIAAVTQPADGPAATTPIPSPSSSDESGSSNTAILVIGIGFLVAAMVAVGFLARRKGE